MLAWQEDYFKYKTYLHAFVIINHYNKLYLLRLKQNQPSDTINYGFRMKQQWMEVRGMEDMSGLRFDPKMVFGALDMWKTNARRMLSKKLEVQDV